MTELNTRGELLREGSFLRTWVGTSLSGLGTAFGILNFVAVVTLEASPFEMGMLTAAGIAPALALGLLAGVWVDRAQKKPLVVAATLGRAVTLGSLLLAFHMDVLRVEQLYVVAFVNGLLRTVFDVSISALIPSLVGRQRLVEANSRLAASESVVGIGGFSVGGWIVQFAGTMIAAGVGALGFLLAAVLFWSVSVRETVECRAAIHTSRWSEFLSGLALTVRHPVLRYLCISSIAEGLLHGFVGAVMLIFGVRELGLETGTLATILAAGSLCSLLGAVSSSKVTHRIGIGPAVVVGFAIFSVGALITPIARGPLLVAGGILVIAQFTEAAYAVYGVNELSLRQAATPSAYLGRVTATVRFVGMSTFMVASVAGGALAEVVSLRWTMAAGGVCGILGAFWLLRSPVWDVREFPDECGGSSGVRENSR